ncbi:cytochrome c oxidase subunit II [Sphingorhabdus sp. Alg239-R122]|uniref:cytochrome c oxidase subunit II n=1 Tax=Sphingorhabdus sp. Alg239-R122 TaxID=2305989 RepID=UPI0013D8F6C9|nr:cytochrome c oxidase subunit II [Sphingorhabdus sp. Alg239-R122]
MNMVKSLSVAALLAMTPHAAIAQEAATTDVQAEAQATTADNAAAATEAATETSESGAVGSYVPMKPTEGKGMPVDGGIDFQDQYSKIGQQAYAMHNYILMPIIVVISLFVLGLLLWVMARYRAKANPEASKTTHNTFIEVVWTLVPVLILIGIAIPSISLLAKQFEPAPEDALTIKVTGYQWYWGYTYPDNGGFEVISNMLPAEEARARGETPQLAVDNRMVVPAGVPIKVIVTAADVIHSFAVPSLWYKMDAIPGRLNEKVMQIDEPGVYYGQCSELCGARHGFMPIAVEALPMDEYNAWVQAQGGNIKGEGEDEAEASEAIEDETADAETANASGEENTENAEAGSEAAAAPAN